MNFQSHQFIQVINQDGRLIVRNKSRRCTKCILPGTFPDIKFSENGVCNYCLNQKSAGFFPDKILLDVQKIISDGSNQRDFDCLMLFSGGKDSSIALYVLKKEMNLRPLAFTLDNGFISDVTFNNMRHICSVLEIDHLIYRPAHKLMKRIYSISMKEPFDTNTTKYSTSSCGSCISMVLAIGAKFAIEKRIPIMAGGWTPGQFTDDPILSSEFLMNVCQRHFIPLSQSSTALSEELKKYDKCESNFPQLFNPLYCRKYNEDQIYEVLYSLGWTRPSDTDSCSTNCRLNGFLILDHIYKYGYHPYEYEIASHIRIGAMSREQGLAKVENIEVMIEDINKIGKEFEIHYEI